MKKIALMIGVLFCILNTNAQAIFPVEKSIDFYIAGKGYPKNAYLKDINNLFDKYLGNWTAKYNGRDYTFIITKGINSYDIGKEDILEIRYLVVNANGTVEEDTRNTVRPGIRGQFFNADHSTYMCHYYGKKAKCGQAGTLYFSPEINPNQMTLSLITKAMLIADGECLDFDPDTQQIFPLMRLEQFMTLIKQ